MAESKKKKKKSDAPKAKSEAAPEPVKPRRVTVEVQAAHDSFKRGDVFGTELSELIEARITGGVLKVIEG